MPDGEHEELLRLREAYPKAVSEIARLTKLIELLQQQLKESLEGNAQLRKLLTDLQAKLDVLISQ